MLALTSDGTLGHGENLNSEPMLRVAKAMDWVNVDMFAVPGMQVSMGSLSIRMATNEIFGTPGPRSPGLL